MYRQLGFVALRNMTAYRLISLEAVLVRLETSTHCILPGPYDSLKYGEW